MSHQFEIAKQIVEETCPHRKLQLENIRLFANVIQCKKYHKGDIILSEGEVCNNLLYIEQGLLRQYYVKHGKDMSIFHTKETALSGALKAIFIRHPHTC